MAQYREDPRYTARTRRRHHPDDAPFDRDAEIRGSYRDEPYDEEPTRDERRMSREPFPMTPYAAAPLMGTPGWRPPRQRSYYSDRQDDYYRRDRDRWAHDDNERDFFDRASDEIASWFGDEDAERRREADHRGRGPKNYTRSDERILEDINDRLTEDAYLDASGISVAVESGEVTLDGEVTSRRAKRRAEDCCDSVSGVNHTQNNLRVQSAPRAQA